MFNINNHSYEKNAITYLPFNNSTINLKKPIFNNSVFRCIAIGAKAVNRIGYDPINNQHVDYYIFNSNAIKDAHKEKKIIVENSYEVNAYGHVPKRSNFDFSIAVLEVDFNDKFF